MSDSKGNFVWYELVTSNMAAAEAFYGNVVGWDAQAFDGSGGPYKILSMKGKGIVRVPADRVRVPADRDHPFRGIVITDSGPS